MTADIRWSSKLKCSVCVFNVELAFSKRYDGWMEKGGVCSNIYVQQVAAEVLPSENLRFCAAMKMNDGRKHPAVPGRCASGSQCEEEEGNMVD